MSAGSHLRQLLTGSRPLGHLGPAGSALSAGEMRTAVGSVVDHRSDAADRGRLEQQLRLTAEENQRLRTSNEQLAEALANLSRLRRDAQHSAHHDSLTGLPNRALLMQRLQEGIAESFRRQQQMALLFIDLNGFKVVNDRYGHQAGDRLLTVVASRISSCVRKDDFACRYGGDEFVVMLGNIGEAASAVGVAEKIRHRIDGRYQIDGIEMQVSASIGLALYPTDGEHHDALLHSADQSMYRSKRALGERRSASLAEHDQAVLPDPLASGERHVRYHTDACGIPL
jgi:diguanylate cyclase (GGDEF)-like protein